MIGECKSDGGEITSDDVNKLSAVAGELRRNDCDPFIVFAKTSIFTAEEIEICKGAASHNANNVILLAKRELEPHYPDELTAEEFDIKPYAHSLAQMSAVTRATYFEPRPKKIIAVASISE